MILKKFNYFANPGNRGGQVFVDGSIAKFRGPFWPPLAELQFVGSLPWGKRHYSILNLLE